MDNSLLLDRINALLNHINEIENDMKGLSLDVLKKPSQLQRAVCFSLAQIGEQMNQLERKIGTLYKDLPWQAARGMRNVIVHDYYHADADQICSTIANDLPELKVEFLKIKEDLVKIL